jgi:hypothetical protein
MRAKKVVSEMNELRKRSSYIASKYVIEWKISIVSGKE